jgi:hypothetical protein
VEERVSLLMTYSRCSSEGRVEVVVAEDRKREKTLCIPLKLLWRICTMVKQLNSRFQEINLVLIAKVEVARWALRRPAVIAMGAE